MRDANPSLDHHSASPLDATAIQTDLQGQAITWDVRVVASIDSTNAHLMDEIKAMKAQAMMHGIRVLPRPILLAAEHQSAGRGQQGRVWHSAPGASLTLSFAWPLRRSLAELSGLSLCCGLALSQALLRHGVAVQLKWPNDALVGGRKLAGILVETQVVPHFDGLEGQQVMAVIGIGINLTPLAHRALSAIDPAVQPTDLQSERERNFASANETFINRNRLAADLASAIAAHMNIFETQGFAAFAEDWNAVDAYAGQQVNLQRTDHAAGAPQERIQGLDQGVDHYGQLRVQTVEGVRLVTAGAVSLRALPRVTPHKAEH